MPKLPDQHFAVFDDKDDKIHMAFHTPARVDSGGKFFIVIPEKFRDVLTAWTTADGSRRARIHYGKDRVMYACGFSLGATRNTIIEIVKESMICEETVTEHIIYCYESTLSYWVVAAGGVAPHGGHPYGKGEWVRKPDGEHQTNRRKDDEMPSLGLSAMAVTRTCRKRPSGETVDWALWRHNNTPLDPRAILNHWCGPECPSDPESKHGEWVVIPYTVEACLWFSNAIKSLCLVDQQFRAFFGNKESVTKAIATGKFNLLAPLKS